MLEICKEGTLPPSLIIHETVIMLIGFGFEKDGNNGPEVDVYHLRRRGTMVLNFMYIISEGGKQWS